MGSEVEPGPHRLELQPETLRVRGHLFQSGPGTGFPASRSDRGQRTNVPPLGQWVGLVLGAAPLGEQGPGLVGLAGPGQDLGAAKKDLAEAARAARPSGTGPGSATTPRRPMPRTGRPVAPRPRPPEAGSRPPPAGPARRERTRCGTAPR